MFKLKAMKIITNLHIKFCDKMNFKSILYSQDENNTLSYLTETFVTFLYKHIAMEFGQSVPWEA